MKIKVEFILGRFGHRGLYVADQRVAGSKPWGGGQVIAEFLVDVDELRRALVKAEAEADQDDATEDDA